MFIFGDIRTEDTEGLACVYFHGHKDKRYIRISPAKSIRNIFSFACRVVYFSSSARRVMVRCRLAAGGIILCLKTSPGEVLCIVCMPFHKKEHCPGVVVTPHGGAMLASLYICRMSMKLMAHDIL